MLCWAVVLVFEPLGLFDQVARRMRVVVGRCVKVVGGVVGMVVAH